MADLTAWLGPESFLYPWLGLLAAAGVTWFWRALGVMVGGRIAPSSALFQWVGCIAYAMLAGLIVRMILLPVGPVQTVPLWIRLLATIVALGVFFKTGRNLLWGLAAGLSLLIGLMAGLQIG